MGPGNEYVNPELTEFKHSLAPNVEICWRSTCSHFLIFLDLVRWKNFTTHYFYVALLAVLYQFQIKQSNLGMGSQIC